MNKREVFSILLDDFEDSRMKLYCMEMIDQIPDYIFIMPSSTSGKYHNATQCQPHGQVYHIIMFGRILNYILNLKGVKAIFPDPIERDAMRCVPIFHDAIKCGYDGGKWTVHEHPILAHDWVLKTKVEHDIDNTQKEMIADMCAAHSGEWTTSNRSKVVLPEPKNKRELFIHICDILSSRNDIDMQPPRYLEAIFKAVAEEEAQDVSVYKLTFGKHRGKTLLEIQKEAPDYIEWLSSLPGLREPVKTLLSQLGG